MIIYTFRIIEATVPAEYNALSDAYKDRYHQIISAGMVDIGIGTKIQELLWVLFGEGTTTRTNLAAINENDDAKTVIENLEMVSYQICGRCHGEGTIMPSYDLGDATPDQITYPICSGAGKSLIGSAIEKD